MSDWGFELKCKTEEEEKLHRQGFHYTDGDNGNVKVKIGEIIRWMTEKPTIISGYYMNENGDELEYVETEFEDLIKRCVIGNRDMFGKDWRISLEGIKDIIDKVYYENGWDEIYDYENTEPRRKS
jgi:hypothetical protein